MENNGKSSVVFDAGRSTRQGNYYHRNFEIEVEMCPDAMAIVNGNEQVTYGTLNCLANLLAHRLISKGVGPDIPVGIYMERSAELVAAVIAIAKAGGVIVPLDPEYPVPYLNSILEETGLHFPMPGNFKSQGFQT